MNQNLRIMRIEMSEAKTLDEWFEGKSRGDGRKFTREASREKHTWFEPIFKRIGAGWYGLEQNDEAASYAGSYSKWVEWHPPKKTKKIKMYRAIIKSKTSGRYWTDSQYFSDKNTDDRSPCNWDVAGWEEKEFEVEDDGSK